MSFTDDDLKRFKEQMNPIPGTVWGIVWGLKGGTL